MRAHDEFIAEAYPDLGDSERNEHIIAYKKWDVEGKIRFQFFLAIRFGDPDSH